MASKGVQSLETPSACGEEIRVNVATVQSHSLKIVLGFCDRAS